MSPIKTLLAWIYGGVTALRGYLYDNRILRSYKSSLKVVSVGNVTAGGNGKTPLCLLLVEEMSKRGHRPVVLSRGYGGTLRGPHMVALSDEPRQVGDEPALLAQLGCSVCISRSRVAGVRMLEQLGRFDLVILDDGLQHRALERDVDIISIFAGSERSIVEFVRGKLLPAGMFRERRQRALARASLAIVSQRAVVPRGEPPPATDSRILRLLPERLAVFTSHLEPLGVLALDGGGEIASQLVHACTAIANPEGFFLSLERLGFAVDAKVSFPDHHDFTEAELRELLAKYPERPFVCTAKDAVKISRLTREVRSRFYVLQVRATIVPFDEFFKQLQRLLGLTPNTPL